jgi:hypothetical protein
MVAVPPRSSWIRILAWIAGQRVLGRQGGEVLLEPSCICTHSPATSCTLPFNPVLDDSAGWPCLRFEATKVRAEQLIPLSAKAAAAIRTQQEHVLSTWPGGSPWLFPGIAGNDDGHKPIRTAPCASSLCAGSRS